MLLVAEMIERKTNKVKKVMIMFLQSIFIASRGK